jgi:hypothetical protein
MRNGSRRTVTAEVAFREELDLFVVGVASDRAGGTYSTRGGTGQAEVDSLFDWPHAKGTARELVRQGERGLAKQRILRSN